MNLLRSLLVIAMFTSIAHCAQPSMIVITDSNASIGHSQPERIPTSRVLVFAIRDIGAPDEESGAASINDVGCVVGWTILNNVPRAFAWASNSFTRISDNYSFAFDINSSGLIVGLESDDPNDRNRDQAVLWQGDVMSILRGPQSTAGGINNAGYAVGRTGDRPFRPLIWRSGQVAELPAPSGNHSSGYRINNNNMIVGFSGGPNIQDCFIWTSPESDPINIAPEGQCRGVNDQGDVVGVSAGHAFRWKNGTLDLLAAGGAEDINESGWIVGWLDTPSGENAFLCRDENANGVFEPTEVRNLNDFLPRNSEWQLLRTTGVNNLGTICGTGRRNGQVRAFALIPMN